MYIVIIRELYTASSAFVAAVSQNPHVIIYRRTSDLAFTRCKANVERFLSIKHRRCVMK